MGTSNEPDVRRHKRGWIVLACLTAVVCAFLFLFIGWYRGYRDWHNSKAAPLFSDIEPADGATVYASNAWIRWTSPIPANGRVLWRKAGSSGAESADAGRGEDLLAYLGSLNSGSKYEYIVEENDGTQTLRSSVRTLNVVSGLSFDPVVDQIVDRDYDQTVKLTLRNRGSQTIKVAARALKHYEDLPSDITGYGSVEVPATIGPNSTQDLRLAVTAADATSDTYDIPIEAAGAYVFAKFHVRRPKLDLAFRVIDDDPKTLSKTIEIHNNGDSVTDLSVHVAKENQPDLALEPSINHLRMNSQASVRITATPVLYLEFESLNAQIEANAGDQSAKFSVDFKAPSGMHLIAFRSASTDFSTEKDSYCTNKPNTCSTASGPPGNGPSGTVGKHDNSPPAEIAKVDSNDLSDETEPRTSVRLMFVSTGGAPPAQNSNDARPGQDAPSGSPPQPVPYNPRECTIRGDCTDEENQHCYSRADELHNEIMPLLLDRSSLKTILEEKATAQQFDWIVSRLQQLDELITAIQGQYEALKTECAKCSIFLPAQVSDEMPPYPSEGDMEPKAHRRKRLADAASQQRQAEQTDHYAALACAALEATTSQHELLPGCLTLAWLEEHHKNQARQYEEDANQDPPSLDFGEVPRVTINSAVIDTASASLRVSLNKAVLAGRWEAAYLKAWLESYERYQGALAAGNNEGMRRQTTAMVEFARRARDAEKVATLQWFELQMLVLEDLSSQMSASIHWNDVLARWRQTAKRNGAPAELSEEMVREGFSGQEIMTFGRDAVTLTPERAARVLNVWIEKMRYLQKERERILDVYPNATYPLPDDYSALLTIDRLSKGLLQRSLPPLAGRTLETSAPGSTMQLPHGFLQALQRRATFIRSHRGGVALNRNNGSQFAAESRAENRACFAWNDQAGQIVVVVFNSTGQMLVEPQIVGRGRQPNIACDKQRLAVFWNREEGSNSVIRVNTGSEWHGEIQVPGTEEALTFVPDGTLVAATSRGVWKLDGDRIDNIEQRMLSQAALAVDNGGKPRVASVQNRHIVVDGSDIGEGEWPSLITTPDGITELSYISHGTLLVRSLKSGLWSIPDPIPADKPSWPTLALDDKGGVRLTYIGPADYGPDATWLVRLPNKQPIMLPSLAGNVTDVWLTTTFNLNQARNHFRRHDLLLTVNDVWIKMFQNTVPEGRYLFRLNPNDVFTSAGKPVPNRIAIHSWHMNPGHYSSQTEDRLFVRTAWSEHYLFAANEEDAKRSRTGEHVNHDQPDLGLFANAADLPIDMPKPGRINIPILIANLGEASSAPTRLVMYRGEGTTTSLGSTQVPALKRGEEKTLAMPLDYDGKMSSIIFQLENNKDFDASNDTLNLVLWEPLPTGYLGPDPSFPKVPLELKVTVDRQPAVQYEILDAFTNRVIAKVVNGEQYGALHTGDYHVAVKPYPGEGEETLFTDDIEHQAGALQQVDLKSGIKIEPQDLAAKMSRWSAIRTDNPGTTAQWQSGSHSFMALAPAEYLIEFQPNGGASGSVLWPQKIQVQPGQQAILNINSGLRLEIPQQLVTNLSHWRVVHAGNPAQVVQELDANNQTVILPPGDYQVSTAGVGSEYQWVTWPQKIQVQPGQQATVTINSGMRLEMPQKLQPDLAHWRVVNLGNPAQVVELDANRRTTIVPPGDYQVSTAGVGSEYQWVTWPQKIQVQPGQQATVTINSGMRLEMPQEIASRLSRWRVLRFGNEQSIVELDANHQTTILPPGDYQISTAGVGNEYNYLVWPQKIQVQFGKESSVKLDCGIRLTGPGSGRGYRFSLKDDTGRNLEEWGSEMLQLVPPGKYSVAAYSKSSADWKTIQNNVVVKPGSVTEITVPLLQQSSDQNTGFHH